MRIAAWLTSPWTCANIAGSPVIGYSIRATRVRFPIDVSTPVLMRSSDPGSNELSSCLPWRCEGGSDSDYSSGCLIGPRQEWFVTRRTDSRPFSSHSHAVA